MALWKDINITSKILIPVPIFDFLGGALDNGSLMFVGHGTVL